MIILKKSLIIAVISLGIGTIDLFGRGGGRRPMERSQFIPATKDPLMAAIDTGDFDLAAFLIKRGTDINAKVGAVGQTLLGLAARNGKLDALTFLINNKADLNIGNEVGDTPLIWATINGNLEVVKALVQNKADVNIKDQYGVTALGFAKRNNRQEIVDYLIQHGAKE